MAPSWLSLLSRRISLHMVSHEVVMIYTREQFIKSCVHGEVLWTKRSEEENKCRCSWFIKVPPISKNRWEWEEFEAWNEKNLKGECHSYFSGPFREHEWWGFTEETDISFWLLRWS